MPATRHIRGIDHLVVCVHDLDAAAATFERLGFTLTPRGRHSVGSENHCVMLGNDYIELLAVPPGRTHPTTRYYTDFLATGEGLAAFALATDSAIAARAELAAREFEASAPDDLSRPLEIDGASCRAEFSLVFIADGQTPGARTFVCEHRTRQYVWLPKYQSHPNGARGIARVDMVTSLPESTAAPYARLFGGANGDIDTGITVPTGGAPIGFATARALAKRFPELWITGRPEPAVAVVTIAAGERAIVQAQLERSGIAYRRMPDGALAVGAETAHGVALVFT